jgi:hypothetical protein
VLAEHCATVGRDPASITTSAHLFGATSGGADPEALATDARRYADAGLDLAIVYLFPPYDPALLAPIAKALGPLAE